MRMKLTQLLILGLAVLPAARQHAQEPGQTGDQPAATIPGAEAGNSSASLREEQRFKILAQLTEKRLETERQLQQAVSQLGTGHPRVADLKNLSKIYDDQIEAFDFVLPQAADDKQQFSFFMGVSREEPTEQEIRQELTKLVKTLRGTEDDEVRKSTKAKLGKLLRYQLAKDLAKRQKQLDAAEAKLAKLRAQIEERRENQDKVADVLVLMMENPEAGVGIPSQWLRSILPPPRPNSDPFGDPFGGNDENPFGGFDDDDPFSGTPSGGDDPFGGPGASGAAPSDPFGGPSATKPVKPAGRDPMDSAVNDPFATPKPAYEVSVNGRDVSVYETYDKGVPILTRDEIKLPLGEGQEVSANNFTTIWMTKKGIVEIKPHPTKADHIVIVAIKKGRTQLAMHPRNYNSSQGIYRVNIDVTGEDPADLPPQLKRPDSGENSQSR